MNKLVYLGNHTQAIEWWHFRWCWVTSTPVSRSPYSSKANISQTVHATAVVAVEVEQEVVPKLPNGASFEDFEWLPFNIQALWPATWHCAGFSAVAEVSCVDNLCHFGRQQSGEIYKDAYMLTYRLISGKKELITEL